MNTYALQVHVEYISIAYIFKCRIPGSQIMCHFYFSKYCQSFSWKVVQTYIPINSIWDFQLLHLSTNTWIKICPFHFSHPLWQKCSGFVFWFQLCFPSWLPKLNRFSCFGSLDTPYYKVLFQVFWPSFKSICLFLTALQELFLYSDLHNVTIFFHSIYALYNMMSLTLLIKN